MRCTDTSLRRHARQTAAIAVALLLGLALTLTLVLWPAQSPSSPRAPSAGQAADSPQAGALPKPSASALPAHLAASQPPWPAAAAAPEGVDPTARWTISNARPRAGTVEYCQVGLAAAGSDEAKALRLQAEQRARQAGERLFSLMLGSADAATRAAALLALDDPDTLAQEARQTQDPTVYAFALQACGRGSVPPRTAHCSFLSPQQMASVDADNVVPWLWMATEAAMRNDTVGVSEAVYRASLARESRQREWRFADLALSALPPDWPLADAIHASARVLEIHASLALPSYVAVMKECARERMHDANLQQTCERLARVLTERGDTLVDYGIGTRIGERAGWRAEEVEGHKARLEALKRTQTDGDQLVAGLADATACGELRRAVQLAFAHARFGERQFAQAELANAGHTDSVAVERHRVQAKAPRGASAALAPRAQ